MPRIAHETSPPQGWPPDVSYLVRARLSPSFPPELVPLLFPPPPASSAKQPSSSSKPPSSILSPGAPSSPSGPAPPPPKFAPRPSPHPQTLAIKTVTTPGHPAHGQRALVARKRIETRTLLLPYLGILHADFTDAEGRRVNVRGEVGSNEHENSDYDLSLVRLSAGDVRNPFGERRRQDGKSGDEGPREGENKPRDEDDEATKHPPPLHVSIGVDAAVAGNAGRFVNDFRGIAGAPNAEFRMGRGDGGEARMEVWSMKRIEKGEEVLVSYGKGWWGARK